MIATPRTSRRHYAVQRRVAVVLCLGMVGIVAEFAVIFSRLLAN